MVYFAESDGDADTLQEAVTDELTEEDLEGRGDHVSEAVAEDENVVYGEVEEEADCDGDLVIGAL